MTVHVDAQEFDRLNERLQAAQDQLELTLVEHEDKMEEVRREAEVATSDMSRQLGKVCNVPLHTFLTSFCSSLESFAR